MESTKRMKTTTSARVLIECNMLRRSQLVLASCSIRTAFTNRVATIRLLLKFQVTLVLRGPTRVFLKLLPGVARLSHDRPASPYYWLREKITSMVVSTSTGSPLSRVG